MEAVPIEVLIVWRIKKSSMAARTPKQASFMPMMNRARLTTRKRAVLFRDPFQRSRPAEESVTLPKPKQPVSITCCVTLLASAFSVSETGLVWETGSAWLVGNESPLSVSELAILAKTKRSAVHAIGLSSRVESLPEKMKRRRFGKQDLVARATRNSDGGERDMQRCRLPGTDLYKD